MALGPRPEDEPRMPLPAEASPPPSSGDLQAGSILTAVQQKALASARTLVRRRCSLPVLTVPQGPWMSTSPNLHDIYSIRESITWISLPTKGDPIRLGLMVEEALKSRAQCLE